MDERFTDRLAMVLPVVSANAATLDDTGGFPHDALSALRDSGLLGLLVPQHLGGLGGELSDLVAIAHTLGTQCLSTALIWAMHCQQVDAILRFGSAELQQDVLPRVAKGSLYLGSVTTGSTQGGSLLTNNSALVPEDGMLLLDRDAPIVTGGQHADAFLVTMKAAPDAPPTRISLVYAERDQVRAEVTGGWDTMGMRATESVALRITGHLPANNLIGEAGQFRTVAIESYAALAHLGWSACWLGTATQALSDYVGVLRSPSRPASAASDLFAERLARIRIGLELPHAYLATVTDEVMAERAAGRSLDTPSTQIHLNVLKVATAEHAFAAVNALVELAGLDVGYRRDSPIALERRLRDLRSASLNFANDRLLVSIGALVPRDRQVRLASVNAGN